jgi:2,5-diamino-6-(ribosylamino)-4(3H)-pyrimidinone 5'-phosphate reductase
MRAPLVVINMAVSADGKISTRRRETFSLGSPEDRHLMDVLRARSDAVLIGSRTLQLDGWAIRVRDADIRGARVAKGRGPHPVNVVVSTALDLPARAQFFTHPGTQKLVITTRAASAARVKRFEKLADIVVLPRRRIRPADVLAALAERRMRRILVEGGGELNYSFFEAGLVDELYITVTPRIIGGRQAPSPVDGGGFLKDSQVQLQLVSARRREDEVFLRYKVLK